MRLIVRYLKPDEKTGILSYRRAFPERLRPFIAAVSGKARRELKVSLGARSLTDPGAMERYQAAQARYEHLFTHAKKASEGSYDNLDGPLIAYLVEKYRVEAMQEDAQARWDPSVKARGEMVTAAAMKAGYTFPEHRQASHWTLGYRVAINAALEAYRAFAADGDAEGILDAWSGPAASLAASHGNFVDQASEAFRELCIRLNEAAIYVHEAELQRMDGQLVPTPGMPPAPHSKSPAKPSAKERSFQAIALEIINKRSATFNEPTKERVRGALRFLEEAVGILTPSELTREKVTLWLDLLAERPSKLPRVDFHCTLHELKERYANKPDVPRLVSKTREAYCLALNARWKEAQSQGAIPEALVSPFSDRKFSRKSSVPKAATGFSLAELKAYFNMPAFTDHARPVGGKGEAIFWIPLLMLFTGARPEEVAQLLLVDIFQHERDGRWVIRFTDQGVHPVKGRQSLKTEGQESGRRIFPIAQPLLDLGLLDYRKHLEGAGETALFPLLRRKGKRRGIYASFGEWMCDYVYDHGVLERGKGRQPVREFRHTWTTASRASRIPREAAEYIQGHRPPDGGSSHEGYGERDDLGDWIDQLAFKVDVVSIVPKWQRR